jgi:hypothetical protein
VEVVVVIPRNYQRKTARKSKLLKLNFGAVRAGDPFDVALEVDWQKLEGAYKPLPQDAREHISAVIKYYIGQDQTEHNAPYLKDAISKVSRLTDSATALLKEHSARDDAADAVALSIVEARFGGALDDILERYVDACEQARDQVNADSRDSGFEEGRAWRSMIWRLLDIVEKFGLPSTVAKPIKESQRRSPFVALVEEIQKQLPRVHWSFPKTHEALAAAIVNIRRERRESSRRKEIITPQTRE